MSTRPHVGGLCACLALLLGCASGGGPDATSTAPAPPADSTASDAINQRILAAAARGGAPPVEASADYRIGPNDLLRIDVFGAEAFSGAFRVEPSGTIAIPLLGSVPVADKTPREVEGMVAGRLRETYMRDPHVTVHVDEMRSHGVSVLGAVRRPGVYQVTGGTTLLEVLAMAEGLDGSAGSTVFVVRPGETATEDYAVLFAGDSAAAVEGVALGEKVIEVDLGALLWSGRTQDNIELRAGDIVQVRPAAFVYVVGEVNRPGGFTMPPGQPMTVLQALAMAGGLAGTAAAGSSVIVREEEDGSRDEIPVDLDDVLRGRSTPPTLGPRDVLFVPKNGAKSFALGVVNALVRMVTFRGLVY